MKKHILIALFLACICCQAQTIAGGELYYKLIGTNKYKLTAVVYRQCSGDVLNTLYNTEVIGGAYTVAVNYTRTSIIKLYDTCGNPCNKQNQYSNAGYEQHTFEAEVDFTKTPYNIFVNNNVCDVIFTYMAGFRPNNNITHNNGLNFIEAGVNICNSFITQNSSPQFLVHPKFEFACNQPTFFNNIGLDTANYDSLAYSLVAPKHDYTTTITYIKSYSATIPVTPYCPPNPGVLNCNPRPNSKPSRGFYFSSKNGDIAFTPTNCSERATIVVRIDEYRKNPNTGKMVYLGFVLRDFSLKVFNENNSNPEITTTNYNPKFCGGYTKCITFNTADNPDIPSQKQADTVRIGWINLIKNSTISLDTPYRRTPNINFCLQPDTFNTPLKEKYFAITLWDRGCNANIQSRLFEIEKEQPKRFSKTYRLSNCGSIVYQILPFQNDNKTSYSASIKKFNNSIIEAIGTGLKDSLTVHENGEYIISYTSSNSINACAYTLYDTITINNAYNRPILSLTADTLLCKNDSVNIAYLESISPSAQYFRWYINGNTMPNTDTFLQKIGIAQNTTIRLTAFATNGCIAHKEITFGIKTFNLLNNIYRTCINTNYSLPILKGTLPKPYQYAWHINGIKTNITDSILNIEINNSKAITAQVTDATGCLFEDNTTIEPYSNYKPNLLPKNVCKDTLTNISVAGSGILSNPNYLWEINGLNNYSVYGNSYTIKTDKPTKLKLTISDRYGCLYIDSANIAIVNPAFTIANDTAICMQQILPLKPSKIGTYNSTPVFNWYSNGSIFSTDSSIKHTITKDETIRLKIIYNSTCMAGDSLKIYAQQNPAFTMPKTLSICKNNVANISPIYNNPNTLTLYKWYSKNTLISQKAISDFKALNTEYIKLNVTNTSKCTTSDSIYITALPLPQPIITGKTQYNLKDTIQLALTKTYNSYKWSVGIGTNSMKLKANVIGIVNGYNILCIVADSNGCKATDTIAINISDISAINKTRLNQIYISPNPFTDNLQFNSPYNGTITITTTEGKLIYTQAIQTGVNTLSLQHLSAGIYYFKFKNENGSWLGKAVKE